MKNTKFYRDEPRAVTTVKCECHAAPELFQPCEGGGLPGEWCAGCRFGKVHEPLEA